MSLHVQLQRFLIFLNLRLLPGLLLLLCWDRNRDTLFNLIRLGDTVLSLALDTLLLDNLSLGLRDKRINFVGVVLGLPLSFLPHPNFKI